MALALNYFGRVFGRWLVVGRGPNTQKGNIQWRCICQCGQEKLQSGPNLRTGRTKSCGCYRNFKNSKRWGVNSSSWKGGRRTTEDGYVVLTIEKEKIFEHVWVMEALLGRKLRPEETVHHKNGIKDNNWPDNLELWASNHPPGQRVTDLISWAKQLLELYGP